MTLAIGWLHDGGDTVETWLHQAGDWHRRQFRTEYKAGILAQYEKAGRGERGALLRREGLYWSHIDAWRKQGDAGVLAALAPTKRGRKPKVVNPLSREVVELRRELARSEQKLKRAEAIIEIQKKLRRCFGSSTGTRPRTTRRTDGRSRRAPGYGRREASVRRAGALFGDLLQAAPTEAASRSAAAA